jgi:hypothetical protein
LGTDGIDDDKVYQTTRTTYDETAGDLHNLSGKGDFGGGLDTSFEVLKASEDTHLLGTKNEFGLIQLMGMGNEYIVNNTGSEDTYSYTNKAGETVASGKHGDDWATPAAAAAFNAAINNFVSSEGDNSMRINVNDASAFNPSHNLGHQTHFKGKSIDMRFLNGTSQGSNNISNLNSTQTQLNGRLMQSFSNAGFTIRYSDNGTIPNTTHSAGHVNHMHISRPNPKQD